MKSKPTCPACGARRHDWLLCDKCTDQLAQALRMIPPTPSRGQSFVAGPAGVMRVGRRQTLPWELDGWQGLVAELELTHLRQSRRAAHVAGVPRGNGSVPTLPFDQRAGACGAELVAALTRWCAVLSPSDHPADDPSAMASWLLARRRQIRAHPAAADLLAEVTRSVNRCLAVIGVPPARDYLGRCEVCGSDLHADRHQDTATCHKCKLVVTGINARKESRLSDALDGLATRSEILSVLPGSFGVHVSQSRFSNWITSGRLQSKGRSREDVPTYRLGDVVDLARARRAVRDVH